VFNNLPDVQTACLYDAQGAVFAQLQKAGITNGHGPSSVKAEKTRFEDTHLCVVQPIIVDAAELGTVYIYADLTLAYLRKAQFLGLIFLVLIAVSILTFLLSTPLLKLISSPIKKL